MVIKSLALLNESTKHSVAAEFTGRHFKTENSRFHRLLLTPPMAAVLLFVGCAGPDRDASRPPPSAYHYPLTSVGAKFGALPSAVRNTITAQTGSAEMHDIVKQTRPGVGTVYRITYINRRLYPPLYVASDGSVLNPDMTVAVGAVKDETEAQYGRVAGALRFADLPDPVAKTVESYAPKAEITSIDRQTWGSRIVYIIGFRDETRRPKIYVASDGTVMRL